MLMPSHRKRQQTADEMLGELWKVAAANQSKPGG